MNGTYKEIIDLLNGNNMYLVCFNIVDHEELDEHNRIIWLQEGFKYALVSEEMDIAIQLWDKYHGQIEVEDKNVMQAVLDCFSASPYYLELKFYILNNFRTSSTTLSINR